MNIQLEDICNLVSLTLGIQQVHGADHLQQDLGAQSLDIVRILTAVERKYDVFLDDTLIPQIETVNDLHRLIQEEIAA